VVFAIQGRRSFRALKGLVRLQGVVRGQNVKRQTVSAMKHMQLLVRVQSQIQSRRIQMLENQARYQAEFKNDKDAGSTFGKLTVSDHTFILFFMASIMFRYKVTFYTFIHKYAMLVFSTVAI
jgi:hypothetical protein